MFSFRCEKGFAEVMTKRGRVRGYEQNGTFIFKGIPYAKAKRFHAPEEVPAWEGVLEATSYGYVCPLLSVDQPRGELSVPHRFWPMDEDCLNLNIWTPALDDKKRPVMVWLHGGGYEAGSSIEQEVYDGANMSALGDAVVVSINHRLNILGYFDLSDFGEEYENSGNAGGDDIIAALRWVRDNIASFGGDPGCVTVFGQSGGGGKVTTLLQSPAADGLYHRGINMSGVINMLADAVGSGREMAEALMEELGFSDVKELETVDYHLLAEAYRKLRPAFQKEGKYVGCAPHPNAHYAGDPLVNGFRKETAHIPMLVGSVFGEFGGFSPIAFAIRDMSDSEQLAALKKELGEVEGTRLAALFCAAYPDRALLEALKLDFIFRGPGQPYITLRSGLNKATWSYIFNLNQNIDGGSVPWHCADIPYVFHNTHLAPATWEPGMREEMEKQIFETVMAFARTGNPDNPSIPAWPASSPEEEHVLIFDRHTHVGVNFDRELVPYAAEVLGPYMMRQMALAQIQH